jgi:hypothetical protein
LAIGLAAGVAANGVGAAEPLGRLFLDPTERAALEHARRAANAPPQVVTPEPEVVSGPDFTALEPPAPRPSIALDGYVTRGDGKTTVWINGVNSYDGDISAFALDSGRTGVQGNGVRIARDYDTTPLTLKPGQSYDPQTGRLTEIYAEPAPADPVGGLDF